MRAVDASPRRPEFIIVDDGSDDGTRAVLTQLSDSTVKVVSHPQNRGKGAAIRTGLEHVTGDLVLIQDADLEYDPDDWDAPDPPDDADGAGRGPLRLTVYRRATTCYRLNWSAIDGAVALPTCSYEHDASPDMETPACHKALRPRVSDHHGDVRTDSTSSPRSPRRSCARGSASTRCRSRTRAGSSTRARRSRGGTGSPRCTRSSSTASSSRRPCPSRAGPRSSSTTRPALRSPPASRHCSRTSRPAARPRWSSSTTGRPTSP